MTALEVYLSGEIHTDWREKIQSGAADLNLSVKFHSPVTDHDISDDCGVVILGQEKSPFWKDHKGAKLNAIRTRTLIEKSDLVIAFWRSIQTVERCVRCRLCGCSWEGNNCPS